MSTKLMTTDDLYKATKQIVKDVPMPVTIAKSRFQVIADIQNDSQNFHNKGWGNALKSKDPYICCAIIESLYAPSEIKKQVIDILSKRLSASHFSNKFIIPFIFSGDNESIRFLTHDISTELVSRIELTSFNAALRDYIDKNPDNTKLPFAETHIEELLLKRILDEASTKPVSEQNYNTYKFVEYYADEDSLKDIIQDLNSHNEYVITAIMNNKNLSPEYRKEAFIAGPDISLISSRYDDEQIKTIYESAICATHINNSNISAKISAAECINQLVQHQLLPESCELDLWRHIATREISVKPETYQSFFKNTKNIPLLQEALKSDRIFAIVDASKNPYAPKADKITTLQSCLEALKVSTPTTEWHKITHSDKLDFFQACIRYGLPDASFYDAVLDKTNGVYRTILKEEIALSPQTPITVLNKLKEDKDTSPVTSTFIYFNEESRGVFSETNTMLFLDTICAISEREVYDAETYSETRPQHFFPNVEANDNMLLTNLLNKVIKEGPTTAKSYAQIYLNTLQQKQIMQQAQTILATTPINLPKDAPIELLQELKKQIQDKLFLSQNRSVDIYGEHKSCKNLGLTHNYYDMYKVYSDGIRYAELYNSIDEKIKQQEMLISNPLKNQYITSR